MNLTSPQTIEQLMTSHGLQFQKSFGQNFLISQGVVDRIAEECGAQPEDGILEIGPGVGSLTQALCLRYRRVVAVEIDRGLIPILETTVGQYPHFSLISEDVMKLPLAETVAAYFPDMRVSVCANLPYYITTPILMRLLESGIPWRTVTVMVQKEVADRLAALPGSPQYGAVTASVRRYGTVSRRFTVGAGNFLPAPKVDSAVITLTPYETKPYTVTDEALLTKVIAGAFAQRRKTLLNSLASVMHGTDKTALASAIEDAGLNPGIRGETLDVPDLARLTDALAARLSETSIIR